MGKLMVVSDEPFEFKLTPQQFAGLAADERVAAKLILYQANMQQIIFYVRSQYHLDITSPIPVKGKFAIAKYAWELSFKERWSYWLDDPTIGYPTTDTDMAGHYWLPFLCLFAKHNVLIPPSLVRENEKAYDSLKADQVKRWEWEERTKFKRFTFTAERDEIKNKETAAIQFRVAQERLKEARRLYKKGGVHMIDESFAPFEERIVYESDRITVGMRVNKIHLTLNSRTTKEDILGAFPAIIRCQKLVKRGKKGRASKYTEKDLDIYYEIAGFVRDCEENEIEKRLIPHEVCSMLKQRGLRHYDIGSIRKVLSRIQALGFLASDKNHGFYDDAPRKYYGDAEGKHKMYLQMKKHRPDKRTS